MSKNRIGAGNPVPVEGGAALLVCGGEQTEKIRTVRIVYGTSSALPHEA